jgi:integrase
MPRPPSIPGCTLHKASGQAVVRLNGKDHYLGRFGSAAANEAYERLIAEWLANGRRLPAANGEMTVNELILAYWQCAQTYYRKNGQPSGYLYGLRVALRWLRQLYGHTPAAEFGPRALRAIQQQMIDKGSSRTYINSLCGRIRRAFKWAASHELLPIAVYQALSTVPGLKRGRSAARETPPVLPVPDEMVQATLPFLPSVVADMVRFQKLVGCRPGEVILLRPCDIDRSEDVWSYRPESHKTEHQGRERVIFIGPQAQAVVEPYLGRSPCRAERQASDTLRAHTAGRSVVPAVRRASHIGLPTN